MRLLPHRKPVKMIQGEGQMEDYYLPGTGRAAPRGGAASLVSGDL